MHAGLIVAVVLVLVSLVIWFVLPAARGVPVGGNVIVRCRRGHLFTTVWVPGASVKAVRLGPVRFQYCPVGDHYSLIAPVRESDLSPDEAAQARSRRDTRIP